MAHTHHVEEYMDFRQRTDAYGPVLDFLESRSGRLLEVGTAAGRFLDYLAEGDGWDLTGVDVDEVVGRHVRAGPFVAGSAMALPFGDHAFDYTVMVSVLHHLVGASLAETRRNWLDAIADAVRVTKPGGHVLIREGLAVRNRVAQQAIWTATRMLASAGRGVGVLRIERGEQLAFLTPSDLQRLAQGRQVAHSSVDDREWAREFSGVVGRAWRAQTCSLTLFLRAA